MAELADVSRQAISQYETGSKSPAPETLQRLSDILNVPLNFFTSPLGAIDRQIFYRSRSAATKTARARAEALNDWVYDVLQYVEQYVDLPDVAFPEIEAPLDPRRLSATDIEAAATEARRHWNLYENPVGNVAFLSESNGAPVTRWDLGADTLDSLSELRSWRRPLISVNAERGSAARWRFDVAHELGHLLLHRGVDKTLLSEEHKLVEDQAHYFAGAFLLPMQAFADDVFMISVDGFLALKLKWGVSVGVMIKRARHIGLIDAQIETDLWKSYSRRRWRKTEPYDDEMEPEVPSLLRHSIELLLTEGGHTKHDLLRSVPLSEMDIENLVGLPRGFLSSAHAPSVVLRFKGTGKPTTTSASQDKSAEVIQLKPRSR